MSSNVNEIPSGKTKLLKLLWDSLLREVQCEVRSLKIFKISGKYLLKSLSLFKLSKVDGHDSKKKINIPKNAFPDEIVDQISNFKS